MVRAAGSKSNQAIHLRMMPRSFIFSPDDGRAGGGPSIDNTIVIGLAIIILLRSLLFVVAMIASYRAPSSCHSFVHISGPTGLYAGKRCSIEVLSFGRSYCALQAHQRFHYVAMNRRRPFHQLAEMNKTVPPT